MSRLIFEQVLPFLDPSGNEVAQLRLVAEGGRNADLIRLLSQIEAAEYGEEIVQILEGQAYQYEVLTTGVRLEQIAGVVDRFLIGTDNSDRGILNPGLRTGQLRLSVCRNGVRIGSTAVEVRSKKIGYRDDYRAMLDDIADVAVDLLLQLRSPTEVRLTVDETSDPETIQQRFFLSRV